MEIIIVIFVLLLAAKLIAFAFKVAYGIGVVILSVVMLPFMLIFAIVKGLAGLCLPIIAVVVLGAFLTSKNRKYE